MPLKDMQHKFRNTMLQPATQITDACDSFSNLFVSDGISVEERLKVYHNNVVGSLCESLSATFPVLENLVGEEFFKSMTRAFIFDNPPVNACLHGYGAGFDRFISDYAPAQSLAYLSDMARFELALNHAYYAQNDLPLPPGGLTAIAPEDLGNTILPLRHSVTLFSSPYPITEIRDFCLNADANETPDLEKTHHCRLLIFRPQLDVLILPLQQDELDMLTALKSGQALGTCVESVMSNHETFNFASFLQKHISLETFCTIAANE